MRCIHRKISIPKIRYRLIATSSIPSNRKIFTEHRGNTGIKKKKTPDNGEVRDSEGVEQKRSCADTPVKSGSDVIPANGAITGVPPAEGGRKRSREDG